MRTSSVEKICDIYLFELYKIHKRDTDSIPIDSILDKKKVFYNEKILDEVIRILSEEKMVIDLPKKTLPTYSKSASLEEALKEKAIMGAYPLHKLTSKGVHFVKSRQCFDWLGRERTRELREKWREWIIKAILGTVITTAILALVKKLFG